jgi:putative transcriptional regulator
MEDFSSLTGQLLVSLPGLREDYFARSVTLLIEHNRDGAFGLVVNKPLEADLGELLKDHSIECNEDVTLLESGPVEQNRLFFLHSSEVSYESSVAINADIILSTSLDIVQDISDRCGPHQVLAGLGYAGWSGGQLENEIRQDVWLVTPYHHDLIFNIPFDERPEEAARLIGIDLNLISPTPGHG